MQRSNPLYRPVHRHRSWSPTQTRSQGPDVIEKETFPRRWFNEASKGAYLDHYQL